MNKKQLTLCSLSIGAMALGFAIGLNSNNMSKASADVTTYTDGQLESYDKITLRDIGLDEEAKVSNTPLDTATYALGNDKGARRFANSSTNTAGSLSLEFTYNVTEDCHEDKQLVFFLRSNSAWTGYRFAIDPGWGQHGVVWVGRTISDSDVVKYGEAEININDGNDHTIELGCIDIKDTNNVWIYAKYDGNYALSYTETRITTFNVPTANVYAPAFDSAQMTLKSTGTRFSYVNQKEFHSPLKYVSSNGVKGFYGQMENCTIPASGWEERIQPMSKYTMLKNGEPYANPLSVLIKTYDTSRPNLVYMCFQDNNMTFEEGDEVVIDGSFGYFQSSTSTKYIYKIDQSVFIFTNNTWKQIEDLRTYLNNKILKQVDYDEYDEAGIDAINAALNTMKSVFENTNAHSYDLYKAYETCKTAIEAVEPNPAFAAEKLREAKALACAELEDYVSLDDYLDTERQTVISYINEGKANINACTKKSDVEVALNNAKAKIDTVKTRNEYIEDKIINRETGYEEYLVSYDTVSLKEVGWGDKLELTKPHYEGESTFPTDTNPYDGDNDCFNTFVTSEENTSGSVAFQFGFKTSSAEGGKYGAQFFLRLRGKRYFSYRFDVSTVNGGFNIMRMEGDGPLCKQVAHVDNAIQPNVQHVMKAGSIDIKNSNRVWLFLMIDGEFAASVITDQIEFAHNARVATSESYLNDDVEDVAIVSDVRDGINSSSLELGRAKVLAGHTQDNNGLYFTFDENSVPYAEDWSVWSYPLSTNAVTLNGEPIADLRTAMIKKYKATSYYLCLKDNEVAVNDGDTVVIDGEFATYDPVSSKKVMYSIKKSTFVFHASDNSWEYVASLEETKADAINELNNYVDRTNYSAEALNQIDTIIQNAVNDINAATTKEAVEAVLSAAKASINQIPTLLDAYKSEAKEEINSYKANELNNYRDAQKEEISALKEEGCAKVDAATTQGQIDAIVLETKASINQIKTNAQLEAEELALAKENATTEIQDYYGQLDLTKYTSENLSALNQIVRQALEDIDAATSVDQINTIVTNAKASMDAVEKIKEDSGNEGGSEEKKGCKGSIIASTSVIALISLAGLTFASLKRKED